MATSPFRKFFRWHVLAWAAYFAYVVVGSLLLRNTGWYNNKVSLAQNVWLNASFQVARIATFYFCYLLVFPRLLRMGRLPLLALGLLAAVLVFMAVRHGIEEVVYPSLLGFDNYDADQSIHQFLIDGLYNTIPNVVLAGALWAGEEALRRERENQQLAADKRAAELAFLKTQLNPHFLYNTLNMLYGLAYGVDKALAGGLLKLSELMRYMLRDTPDGLVNLGEEVAYLANFLDLHRLRYPGRLHAELTVAGDPTGYRVAPLLLIPFVENAFKHGVLDDPATPVRLNLVLTPGSVEFTVENQRHEYLTDSGSGIGLVNLRRRLELLYPSQYSWHVGPVGQKFRAQLRLDVPAEAPVMATPNPMDTMLPVLATVTAT